MRVYHPTGASHSLFVAPAADPRTQQGSIDADWLEEDGKPKGFLVSFVDGRADVPDSLGRYLCHTGQASRLYLPWRRLAA